MPLEFAQANAPTRIDPPMEVCINLTLSHSLSLSAFFAGTEFGAMKTRSVASEYTPMLALPTMTR